MKPEQLLQQLVSGEISPQEFKALARTPGALASPEVLRRAFRVWVTADGYEMETGQPFSECLPRLKKKHGLLKVIQFDITWQEWQEVFNNGECPVDKLKELKASAQKMGVTPEELERQAQEWEDSRAVLY